MRARSQQTAYPELPSLDGGVHLLKTDEKATGPLQSLILDHLLLNDGHACWVDARGHAVTHSLAKLAPSMRTLERIHVARGFTAYQHYDLVETAQRKVNDETTLLVLPAMDSLYREADDLNTDDAQDLLVRALATVAGIATRRDIPVLLTKTGADELATPLENAADEIITCEQTKFGPRFSSGEFETVVYPVEDGYVQTTLAFWKRILDARQPLYETASTPTPEVTSNGAY